jgi:ketopantoate reductase
LRVDSAAEKRLSRALSAGYPRSPARFHRSRNPSAALVEPGVVKLHRRHRFTLGELDGQRTPRIEALSKSMMAAGFKAPVCVSSVARPR